MDSFMNVKKEIRILAFDDTPFEKKDKGKKNLIIGVIFRGGGFLDGVLSSYVVVDGKDATEKIIELVKNTRHLGQLKCIMLKGLSFGGFNVIDIKEINKKTKLPVIVFMRKKPNMKEIYKALEKAIKNKKSREEKKEIIKKAGKIFSTKINNKEVYFQISGIPRKKAEEIIKLTATHALVPEPLRVAHLIAQGIVLGESKGRA
ncbi:MAG: DUF99 family protein [Candidatus Pacearchaeota archaeon]